MGPSKTDHSFLDILTSATGGDHVRNVIAVFTPTERNMGASRECKKAVDVSDEGTTRRSEGMNCANGMII